MVSSRETAEKYEQSLQALDALLSVRWGPTINQWVVQRKSFVGEEEIKFLKHERERMWHRMETGKDSEKDRLRYPGIAEELACALDQKRVILFVDEFSNDIFRILALGDIKQYGGYSRYHDEQDQKIIQEENKRQKAMENQRLDLNREMFGRGGVHDFIRDKRQTELQHGKRDVKQLLGIKGRADWESIPKLVDANGRPLL